MDDRTSRKLCQLIAGMLVADDLLDPAEDEFFERLLARFGLATEARRTLFPVVDPAEAAAELRTMPADDQRYAMHVLIMAATVDGRVVARERRYLDSVAAAIGLSEEELEQRIADRLVALE